MATNYTDEEVGRARGITEDQIRLLRQIRGLTNEALSKISEHTLRRAVRRLEYPDMPRAREAFLLLHARDERGQVPPNAIVRAFHQLDSTRTRVGARPRIAGIPTGRDVAPRALLAPPAAGLQPQGWVSLGPGNIGGRTRAIVVHPDEP